MCGICGIHGVRDASEDLRLVRAMTELIVHRGPDDGGAALAGRTALGNRRLSIIDVAGGHQPLSNEDGAVTITFNGQVYNYREIQEELLRKGHVFRSHGDTETVVHLYEEIGERLVDRLRGMYAFAIADRRGGREKFLLVRDRLGIKPLHYAETAPGRIVFGSELKTVLLGLDAEATVDPEALLDFLVFGYVPAPKTIFREIRKLPAGHFLVAENGRTRIERYWDLEFDPDPRPRPDAEIREEILAALDESVRIRLMSEVPLGAFLSGGIDSAAVVTSMALASKDPVRTVTVGFEGAGAVDERAAARRVAERIGADHRETVVTADVDEALGRLSRVLDEPFGDSSVIPTFHVSRAARERVTVALSGDGGDENFAGYRRYAYDRLENRLRGALPRPFRALLGAAGRAYPKLDFLPRPFRWKTLLTNLGRSAGEAYFRSVAFVSPEIARSLLAPDLRRGLEKYDPFAAHREHFERARHLDPLARVQYLDVKTYLVDDILTKVDRASMAVSLEARVPLLDHRFMEMAARLPSGAKLRGMRGKIAFREALRPRVPGEILDGEKRGFSVPLGRWMRDDLREKVDRLALSDDPLTDRDAVRRLVAAHRSGRSDHGTPLFSLLMLRLWHERYGDGGGRLRSAARSPEAAGAAPRR